MAILGKYGPTCQSAAEKPQGKQQSTRITAHPSVNKLPKEPSGTQTPLIPSRDKALPNREMRIGSYYQGQASAHPIRKPTAIPHTDFSHKGGRHQK